MLVDTCEPLPMEPGKLKREGDEYERQGVCNILLAYELLTGKCCTLIAAQRTKQEWTQFIR